MAPLKRKSVRMAKTHFDVSLHHEMSTDVLAIKNTPSLSSNPS